MGKKEIIEGISSFRKNASREFRIQELYVFGSLVSGKMGKDSDIDLILVSKVFSRKKFFKRAIGLRKYWKLDYPVDFLCYTPEEFDKMKKGVTIVSEAVKEGISIN